MNATRYKMPINTNKMIKDNNTLQCQLTSIARCLVGISKDDLSTAELQIMEVLIEAGIAEYSKITNCVKLKG